MNMQEWAPIAFWSRSRPHGRASRQARHCSKIKSSAIWPSSSIRSRPSLAQTLNCSSSRPSSAAYSIGIKKNITRLTITPPTILAYCQSKRSTTITNILELRPSSWGHHSEAQERSRNFAGATDSPFLQPYCKNWELVEERWRWSWVPKKLKIWISERWTHLRKVSDTKWTRASWQQISSPREFAVSRKMATSSKK